MQVIATARGYYGGRLIERGESFTIHAKEDFSSAWMVSAAPEKPAQPTGAVKK